MKWNALNTLYYLTTRIGFSYVILTGFVLPTIRAVTAITSHKVIVNYATGSSINYTDSVPVFFRYDNNNINTLGTYYLQTDQIKIKRFEPYSAETDGEGGITLPTQGSTVAHELKHAQNIAVLRRKANTNADELSAITAQELHKEGITDKLIGANLKVYNRMQTSSITSRHDIKNHTQQEINKITKEINERFAPSKDTVIMMERDLNYTFEFPLDQPTIDRIMRDAINEWKERRHAYKKARLNDVFTNNTFTSDADLGKLFTFKINGVHHSLFYEASPEVQDLVRKTANADSNLDFMAKYAKIRE